MIKSLKKLLMKIKKYNKTILRIELILIIIPFLCLDAKIAYSIPSVRETIALATTAKPETFTELYFEDHLKLPDKVSASKTYAFKFTIHNLENKDMEYPYQVYIKTDNQKYTINSNNVSIKNNEYKTISETFSIPKIAGRSAVVVNLIDKSQQIDFWINNITIAPDPSPLQEKPKNIVPEQKHFGGWYWQPQLRSLQK